MKEITNMNLGIGIPLTWTHVSSPFFDSFVQLKRPTFEYIRANKGSIDDLRNEIVVQAKMRGCSHLIMMDTDMTYHPDTIPRLLSHRLPVVGALCCEAYPPFTPIIFRGRINHYRVITEWQPDELLKVDATGTGCLLFDMEVFDAIKPPWFKFRKNPNKEIGGLIHEDIGFCSKLKRAGYKIYVDTSVPAGHLGIMEVTVGTWRLYSAMKRVKQAAKEKETAQDAMKAQNHKETIKQFEEV